MRRMAHQAAKMMLHIISIQGGVCDCSCSDKCPIGKSGMEARCTETELSCRRDVVLIRGRRVGNEYKLELTFWYGLFGLRG